jgi:curli biogenesis system outer membrane secretion channel CsgG
MARWQAGLEKRQAFLGRIVDIGSELFVMAATCTYAQTVGTEHPERAQEALELGDLFCLQARQRVESLFRDLWTNEDEANYAGAQRVLSGAYTWLEEGIIDSSGQGPMLGAASEQQHQLAETPAA